MADLSQPSAAVQLIIDRREHPGPLRRRISVRSAAKRATALAGEMFSEPSWRRIESGDKHPDDRELVFMAAAINDLVSDALISPDDLEQAGEPRAAELFRAWIRERTKADPALAAVDPDLTPESHQLRFQAALNEIRSLPISDKERKEVEAVLLSQLDATLQALTAQLRILRPR
ncbi:hypothetical protein [Microbispora bryophytorum]|uniref:hypothetical protein n=1 Tax=Microbispora bryophytorum TaxID=1460882 RepID=UPI0033DDAF2F